MSAGILFNCAWVAGCGTDKAFNCDRVAGCGSDKACNCDCCKMW